MNKITCLCNKKRKLKTQMNVSNDEDQEYTTEGRNNNAKAKRTRLDDAALRDAIDILDSIKFALTDVLLNADSFAGACKKRGLYHINIKKLLISKAFSACRTEGPPLRLEETVVLEPDGFEQLYLDVFGMDAICDAELPLDFRQTVFDVIGQLNEQEQKVLRLRYGFCDKYGIPLTLEKTGCELGITAPRVKVIQNNALCKLQHPPLKTWLMEGSIQYQARQKVLQSDLDTYKATVYSWLNSHIAKTDRAGRQENDIKSDIKAEDIYSLGIDAMGFSNRTGNCLKRAGKNTFRDVLELTEEDMSKIRGLGWKCREEINRKRMEWLTKQDDNI